MEKITVTTNKIKKLQGYKNRLYPRIRFEFIDS